MNETTDAIVQMRVDAVMRSMAAQRVKAFQDDPAGVFGDEARESVINDLSGGDPASADKIRVEVLGGMHGDIVARRNMDLQREYASDPTYMPRLFSRSERANIGMALQGGEDKMPLDPRRAAENLNTVLQRFGGDGELRKQALRELKVPPVFAGLSGALNGGYNDFLGTFLALRSGNDGTRIIQERFHLEKKDDAEIMISDKARQLEKHPVIGKMLELSGQGDIHAAGVARDLAASLLLLPKDRRDEILEAVSGQYTAYQDSPQLWSGSKIDVVLKAGSQTTEGMLDALRPWQNWRKFVANVSGFPVNEEAYGAFVAGVKASKHGVSAEDAGWLKTIGVSQIEKGPDGTFVMTMNGVRQPPLSDKALQTLLQERAGIEIGRNVANTRLVSDGEMFALQRLDGDRSYIATFSDGDLAKHLVEPKTHEKTVPSAVASMAQEFAGYMKGQFADVHLNEDFFASLPDKIEREMPWLASAYGQLRDSAEYLQELQRWYYEFAAERPLDMLTRAFTVKPE